MNVDAAARYASRAAALKAHGLDTCRRSALASLRPRTVVKESHGAPVSCMAFNTVEPAASNLFASVGGDQATVYDDCHFGDFVGIVVQYTHPGADGSTASAPPPNSPAPLTACAWTAAPPGAQPHGDAWLAVGGRDGALSLISVSEARVAFRMTGDSEDGPVLAVSGTGAARPGVVAALHASGALRAWAAAAEAPLAAWAAPGGTAIAFHPSGRSLAVGSVDGSVRLVALPPPGTVEEGGAYPSGPPPASPPAAPLPLRPLPGDADAGPTLADATHSSTPVDALAFLGPDGGRLAVKHADGRVVVWGGLGEEGEPAPAPAVLAAWRVPGHGPAPPHHPGPSAAALAVTADGALLAAGSPAGEAFVFDVGAAVNRRGGGAAAAASPASTAPAPTLARLAPPRVGGPVRSVALSDDGRHLSVAVGGGFVFRFEATEFGPTPAAATAAAEGGGPRPPPAAAGQEGEGGGGE